MRYIFILLSFSLLFSCKNKGIEVELKQNEIFYITKLDSLPAFLKDSVGNWVKPGARGFGILEIQTEDSVSSIGMPLPCEIVSFHANGIKCKVTETTFPYGEIGCEKIGVNKGELWLENKATLFETRDEALAYLKRNKKFANDILNLYK